MRVQLAMGMALGVGGHAAAIAAPPDLVVALTGRDVNDFLGISVSTAGDMNGDGFDDFAVGANGNKGRVYVNLGGFAITPTPDLVLADNGASRFGESVSSAGDFNGDGYSDLIVGGGFRQAYLFHGGPSLDASVDLVFQGEHSFGTAVSSAGDVNGDGFDDVIIGDHFHNGQAFIFLGGPSGDSVADVVLTGTEILAGFGASVGSAGDTNGDGFDDVLVGAPWYGSNYAEIGRVYLFFGGPTMDDTPDLIFTGEADFDTFGYSLGLAGDVDADGFDDFIIGAGLNDAGGYNVGRAYIYLGDPAVDAVADWVLTGDPEYYSFGTSVGGAGDVNADGFSDVIVGAPSGGTLGPGRAHVFYGGAEPDNEADLMFEGEALDDRFGISVACAGDLRGDGHSDLIVGAMWNDAGGFNAGRAYVMATDHSTAVQSIQTSESLSLDGPFPNPQHVGAPSRILFDLTQAEMVRFELYDIRGRRVSAIPPRLLPAGAGTLLWDTRGLATGTYYIQMGVSSGRSATSKWTVIR
ncbi:MAG: hypothetical protein DHS20C21_07980 [Gemmatimonadota bacterium]|nr:MAG: hypothetical protein DHS20C21_07980 [Gemmatimonadota bacterium]